MICTTTTNKKSRKSQPRITPARIRKRLEAKLLALGGSEVFWQGNDPQAALIAERGQLFDQRVRMRRGQPNRCHENAAVLWASEIEKCQLVTGYALSGDTWWSHSWVVEGDNLYETTHPFRRYFGVVLDEMEALKFFVAHAPSSSPGEFATAYPQLMPLVEKFLVAHECAVLPLR
jgi:hypothetical protein